MDKKRAALIAFGGLLVLLGIMAFWLEPRRLVIRREAAALPGLSRPLKVVLFSDIHAGAPHMTLERLERVVAAANAEKPDAVFILGDFVSHACLGGRFIAPEKTAAVLAGLAAPLGVRAVLGNHDWWFDGERVRRALREAGVEVLENEGRLAGPVWVGGLADLWTRPVVYAAALKGAPKGVPILMLTHEPDVFPQLDGRAALVLAGHTHGGQVRLPFLGTPVIPSKYGQRYAGGWIEENGRRMFVTTGLGVSILPVRFQVPPEIVVLSLNP